MSRNIILLSAAIFFSFAGSQASAFKYSCQSVVNIIHNDIQKYGDNLKNQRLDWMRLDWLKSQLGNSDTSSNSGGDTLYEWNCENNRGRLTAQVDANGNLMHIDGEYDSDNESGLFSTDIPLTMSEQAFNQMLTQVNSAADEQIFPPSRDSSREDVRCRNVITQIRADVAHLPTSGQIPHFAWMDLNWLQQKLGKGQSTVTYNYVYTWPNYSLFAGVDGTLLAMGTPPRGFQPKTAAEALNVLGNPKKSTTEKINQISWQCPAGDNSTLTFLTDKDNILTTVMGRDCSDETCEMFFTPLTDSALRQKFKQQAQIEAQASIEALTTKLRDYNAYFKTDFSTQEQLNNDVVTKVQNYYSSLRQCSPGIYQYALPVLQEFLFNTSIIGKQNDGQCPVVTSFTIKRIGKVVLKCDFKSESLQLFTDQEALAAAQGLSRFDSENPKPLQKAMDNDCKRYIDGTP